jgi:hypothetical protein
MADVFIRQDKKETLAYKIGQFLANKGNVARRGTVAPIRHRNGLC